MALALTVCLLGQHAVLDALRWLARHQSEDGSWGRRPEKCTCGWDPEALPAPPAKRDPEVQKKAKPLIDALGSDEPESRDKASAALAAMGEPAVPYLEDAAKDGPDSEVRGRARDIVAKIVRARERPEIDATGMALLAFLGEGYSHLSKDVHDGICFGETVKKGLQWLMQQQDKDGGFAGGGELAAFALAEGYGLTGSQLFKDPAQKAVDALAARQRASGAWGAKEDDPVATFWSMCVLKSAELDGLTFDSAAYKRGQAWTWGRVDSGKDFDRASAVVTRIFVERTKEGTAEAAKALARTEPEKLDPPVRHAVALALYQQDGPGGGLWKSWNEKFKDAVVKPQHVDGCAHGSWDGGRRVRATALNALSLEVYYRYANVFGGK